jgi:hypothetical protein
MVLTDIFPYISVLSDFFKFNIPVYMKIFQDKED